MAPHVPSRTDQIGQIDTTGVGAGKSADLRNVVADPNLFEPSPASENPAHRVPDDPEQEGGYPNTDVDPTQHAASNLDTTGSLPGALGVDYDDPAAHIKVNDQLNDAQVTVDTTDPENGVQVPGEVLDPEAGDDHAKKADEDAQQAEDESNEASGPLTEQNAEPIAPEAREGGEVDQEAKAAEGAQDDAKTGEGSGEANPEGDGPKTIDDLTKDDLTGIAKRYELEGYSALNKPELLDFLRKNLDITKAEDEQALVDEAVAARES